MKSKYSKEFTYQASTTRIYPNQNATFAKFPNWLMRRKELTPGAKTVHCRLSQSAGKELFACIKLETLARDTGFSLAQVKRYISELAYFGLIEVEQIGLNHANRYYFLQHSWMDEKDQSTLESSHMSRPESSHMSRPESSHMSRPESSHVSRPESSHMSRPESSHVSRPLNRSYKKIQLKEHTQKKESVCEPPSKVSQYSKEEWLRYALSQKNIDSPEALASSLSKSKENDHLMKKFIEVEEKQKQKLLEEQEAQKQKSLELEKERLSIISSILSQGEPFSDSERSLLTQLGYCFQQNSH